MMDNKQKLNHGRDLNIGPPNESHVLTLSDYLNSKHMT